VQAGCCFASWHTAVLSSRHTALLSACRPLTVPPSCRLIAPSGCCVAPRCIVVLSSRCPLTPNVTRGARDDGGRCPPPPRTSTLLSGWASPSRHRCPHHRPGCYFLPSNLVAIAIALAAVTNASFVARHPRPPLLPSLITITLFDAIAIACPPPLLPSPSLLPPSPFPLRRPPPS
jgi:hypothetical protein